MPYTTKQAAKILGLSEDMTKQHCQSGDLEAEKFGHIWRITEEAIEAFQEKRLADVADEHRIGRPPRVLRKSIP